MDEITTAVIHIKQLYTENLKRLMIYKKVQNNNFSDFEMLSNKLIDQKKAFCETLEKELKKLEKLGVKILIHKSKLSNFLKKKLVNEDKVTVFITLTHLEKCLISEYKHALTMLNPNSEIYKVLLSQKGKLENMISELENLGILSLQKGKKAVA